MSYIHNFKMQQEKKSILKHPFHLKDKKRVRLFLIF